MEFQPSKGSPPASLRFTMQCDDKELKEETVPAQGSQGAWQSIGLALEDKIQTSSKLLGTKGIATRNKDATRGSWPYY